MEEQLIEAVGSLLNQLEALELRVAKQDECIEILVDHLADTRAQVNQLIEDQRPRVASAKTIEHFMNRASVQTLLNNMPEFHQPPPDSAP